MSEDSVSLSVDRTSDRDIKMRDLYVTVDDEPEHNLQFGQSLELRIGPGEHRIRVTNRVFRDSATFQAQPGDTIRYEAANVQKIGMMNAIAFIGGGLIYRPTLKRV